MTDEDSRELGPRQLRALAHPLRIRLLGLLRTDGPATATQLAVRLGESSGATSYHLRQLASYGFVEDVPEHGAGRERWWQAAFHKHSVQSTDFLYEPELRGVLEVYQNEVLSEYIRLAGQWLAEQDSWGRAWVESSTISDYLVRVTPSRLKALVDELEAVIARYEAGTDEGGEEQAHVEVLAFPRRPGQPGETPGTSEGERT